MRRLLVDFARVGDLVMLSPIMRHLAKDGELDLLTRPWGRPLFAQQPWIAQIHSLSSPNRGAKGLGRIIFGGERRRVTQALIARQYDEIVLFKFETAALRTWIESWRGKAVLRDITRRGEGNPRHVVEANRNALAFGRFPLDGFDPLPRLTVPAAALAAARARLRPLGERVLAIQAGSSLTHTWWRKRPNLKGLTAAQWADLIARLLDAGACDAVVLHGSAPEGREARAIRAQVADRWRARVHDWTGEVPLDQLSAVLAASVAAVSVDTGPAHIAAAVGCPLLVLFGPTDPGIFLPHGPGAIELLLGKAPCQFCHGTPLFKRCRANICLNTLSGEALMAAWGRLATRISATASPAVADTSLEGH